MSRVTSLTSMSDQQLNRLIKRVGLLFVVVLIVFVAFYVFDRYNPVPQASKLDAAIAVAEQGVKDNPADIAVRGGLADLYVQAKRYQEAVVQYDAIIATGKQEVLARMGRARAEQGLGNVDEAISDWARVVTLLKDTEFAGTDTNLATAYYMLGTIAESQGKSEDAVNYLSHALAITRSDADTMYALGVSYTSIGKYDEAIATLKAASAFVPVGWPEPYTAMATAYTKKGNTDMAEWATAMAQFADGDATGAMARLTKLVDGPVSIDAMTGLGLIAESEGDSVTAAGWYEKVLAKDPSNAVARLGMTRVRPVPAGSAAAQSEQP